MLVPHYIVMDLNNVTWSYHVAMKYFTILMMWIFVFVFVFPFPQ